jgi:hypothetical protein
MSISITIDNDRVAAGIQNLIEDESSGVQTPVTTDTGNEIDVTLTNPVGGSLGGFVTSFNNFLNNSGANAINTLFSRTLSDAQRVFAAANDGASSSADFVKVTASNGETVSDLFFSDSNGAALDGDAATGVFTLANEQVYLWSNGDYCIATTSSVSASAGRIVAAFYLNDSDPNHLQAQVQMVTFEPLSHPVAGSTAAAYDDALNFSNVLQVSAAGSQSFDFDALKSSGALWVAVGNNQTAIVVSGYSLDVDGAGKIDGSSNKIAVSQGGTGTTIGLNNQLFDANGERAVFTLASGLDSLTSADGGILSDYIVDHTGPAAEGLNYTGYINVTGAGIFLSQSQGTPTETKDFDIDLYHAGGASNTPETGFNYIGTEPSGAFLDDTPINAATVTIKDDQGNLVATWVAGADPDGAGPLLGNGATIHHVSAASGAAGNNVTVTITGNNIDIGGVLGGYTVSWTSAGGATFNRFTLKDEGAGKFDVGRVDLVQGVSSHTPVGGNLVVQDDGPSITASSTGAPSITDDESNFAVDNFASYAAQFTPVYGTDGSAGTPVTYAISATANADSGLIESGTGNHVFLFNEGGTVVGRAGTSAAAAAGVGHIVFVASIDGTGTVTLDQRLAVVHTPNITANDVTTLSSSGLVTVTATAHDGDGDTASTGLPIGTLLNFQDDAPAITAQILDGEVAFVQNASISHSLNGAIGADGTSSTQTSLSGTAEYAITYWDTTPVNVYPDLNAVLSNNGTVLTYYSDVADTNAVYRLTLDPLANSGQGGYTFTVLQPPPVVSSSFAFTDLPSGQNLMGVVATDKADLTKGGLLVFPSNPVLNADGTFTNTSGTINTSKGGGPVTIGNGNQAFDSPQEGAYFMYVDNPTAASVGGVGLTQTSADDADTIGFNGLNQSTDSSVTIVQASGAGTAKRPGPAMQIHAFEAASNTTVNSDSAAEALVNNPVTATGATEVDITGIKIHDSTGAVIEYRTVIQTAGGANFGDLHGADSAVGIQFILADAHGAGTADDVYYAVVSNLKANYTIEFLTATNHDIALVQNVSGSFDIGGFAATNQVTVPAQDFHFAATITDYDNDAYGGHLATFADWTVHIDPFTV